MNTQLSHYIRRYIAISDSELELFNAALSPKKLATKEYLLQAGRICTSRYFITKGCLQLYYINTKGNNQIVHFGLDNWWITDYESLIHQVPSKLYIQAIEPTEILALNIASFEKLCQQLPKVERLFRIIMERSYVAAQRRLEFMFSLSGEELYRTFIAANPTFAQRIPQYMLASYLGFTPEFLSKIRAKKK